MSLLPDGAGLIWRVTIEPASTGYGPYHLLFDNGVEAATACRCADAYLPDYVRGGVREVTLEFREVSAWKRAEAFPPGWAKDHLNKLLQPVDKASEEQS